MKQFRLPRKLKKSINKKLWLYPEDEKGNSLMACPAKLEEDYLALKKGILINLHSEGERDDFREKLDQEVSVPDEALKEYAEKIFRKDYRFYAYTILRRAKKHPKAVKAYYNFVNAYHLFEQGDSSYGNLCCMAVDHAEELLRAKK